MGRRKSKMTYSEECNYTTYAIKRKPLHFWVAQGESASGSETPRPVGQEARGLLGIKSASRVSWSFLVCKVNR